MISYAQNGEDVLLARLFTPDHRGFYIDVGANHPTLHSVTRHFYDLGWRGINIEPVAKVFDLLCQERPGDLNLNVALSDRQGAVLLHEPVDSLGMSTLSKAFAGGLRADGFHCVEREILATTLALVCEEHVGECGPTIDFLKVDVEGHEAEVLRGGDWKRWRPRVVVVEATIQPEHWEPILLAADYQKAAFDGLNRYYLRSEDAEFLPKLVAPVNILDQFTRYEDSKAFESLQEELEALRDQIAQQGDLGPLSLELARRIQGFSRRFPRTSKTLRRWFGQAV